MKLRFSVALFALCSIAAASPVRVEVNEQTNDVKLAVREVVFAEEPVDAPSIAIPPGRSDYGDYRTVVSDLRQVEELSNDILRIIRDGEIEREYNARQIGRHINILSEALRGFSSDVEHMEPFWDRQGLEVLDRYMPAYKRHLDIFYALYDQASHNRRSREDSYIYEALLDHRDQAYRYTLAMEMVLPTEREQTRHIHQTLTYWIDRCVREYRWDDY